jgi:hypothetical protein
MNLSDGGQARVYFTSTILVAIPLLPWILQSASAVISMGPVTL